MSKGLDPDQDRHSVGPDLGPNGLQRLSAEGKRVNLMCCANFVFTCIKWTPVETLLWFAFIIFLSQTRLYAGLVCANGSPLGFRVKNSKQITWPFGNCDT